MGIEPLEQSIILIERKRQIPQRDIAWKGKK